MSDGRPESPESPVSMSAPTPMPLDTTAGGGRRRRLWPWIVGALILALLLGGCIAAVWLLDDVLGTLNDSLSDASSELAGLVGSAEADKVAWSGDGAYAVIQYHRDYLYPSVAVWDRSTGLTRTLDGYRVLFVEPYAPVVWMEPVSDADAESSDTIDGLGDAIDHKPARLVAWRLDDDSKPTDNVPAKWRAWPGPGETIAYLEINPLKGAGPAALLFNNKAGQGEGVKAEIPSSTGTFVPVGWSPSGKYFAIEELIDEQVAMDAFGADLLAVEVPADVTAPSRRLVVFDAATGKVSATALLPRPTETAPLAIWEAKSDRLFWLDPDNTPDPDYLGIRSMTATGTEGDAFAEFAWHLPGQYPAAGSASSLGWDTEGPLFAVDGDIWRIGLKGATHLGVFNPRTGAWHPTSGLLGVTTEYDPYGDAPTERTEAQTTNVNGGDRKIIWKGPVTENGTD